MTEFNRCHYPSPVDTEKYPVMTGFQADEFEKSVMTQCNGLQECQASIPNTFLGAKARGNWNVFVFAQVACEQDEEMRQLKNALGLAVSVLGLAICLIYRTAIVAY